MAKVMTSRTQSMMGALDLSRNCPCFFLYHVPCKCFLDRRGAAPKCAVAPSGSGSLALNRGGTLLDSGAQAARATALRALGTAGAILRRVGRWVAIDIAPAARLSVAMTGRWSLP